ncbi:MAG: multidrug efflux SMR transporter [Deltaproteobacteria bacterium]|nr:MAG: multidrug efflux SMR transporter [Deltaproteobacteria bacterium]
MGWVFIVIAGGFEVVWAVALKHMNGLWQSWSLFWVILGMAGSTMFLALGLKTLPVGTAYAVWTGLGAAGVGIIGIVFFRESVSPWRLFFLCLLCISILGLKFQTNPT